MRRAMSKQAEAEREKRAKIINAEGEYQAAEKLVLAANLIAKEPTALQLRYLQTLTEMGLEQKHDGRLPEPDDLIEALAGREPKAFRSKRCKPCAHNSKQNNNRQGSASISR